MNGKAEEHVRNIQSANLFPAGLGQISIHLRHIIAEGHMVFPQFCTDSKSHENLWLTDHKLVRNQRE